MKNVTAGLIFVILGVLLLLDNLDVADFGYMLHHYWPLILIIWGLSILLRRRSTAQPMNVSGDQPLDSELIHESDVFGEISVRVASKNFKGGSISTVFGSCTLDLSDAVIAEGEHELRLHSVFGASRVLIPQNSAVSVSANTIIGSADILGQQKGGFSTDLQTSTPQYSSSSNRLKIIVSTVFGEIRVS